jgi:hypothetical protein
VGCSDSAAANYDPNATIDSGECIYCDPGTFIFQVDMFDSFGDGWQGCEYYLFDNLSGTLVDSGSIATAFQGDGLTFGYDRICLAPGCYLFQTTMDTNPGEVSIDLSDQFGTNYGTVGSEADYGVDFTLTGQCGFSGCIDSSACNFSSSALVDDGSCEYVSCVGCTDAEACNYNELATTDDGSCCYEHCLLAESSVSVEVESGLDGTVLTLDPVDGVVRACLPWGCYVVRGATSVMWDGTSTSGVTFGDGQLFEVGTTECLGCTDELACNYAPLAAFDDGACQLLVGDFTGDQFVGIDDILMLLSQFQSCVPEDNCVSDIDANGVVGIDDLLILLSSYGEGC